MTDRKFVAVVGFEARSLPDVERNVWCIDCYYSLGSEYIKMSFEKDSEFATPLTSERINEILHPDNDDGEEFTGNIECTSCNFEIARLIAI